MATFSVKAIDKNQGHLYCISYQGWDLDSDSAEIFHYRFENKPSDEDIWEVIIGKESEEMYEEDASYRSVDRGKYELNWYKEVLE